MMWKHTEKKGTKKFILFLLGYNTEPFTVLWLLVKPIFQRYRLSHRGYGAKTFVSYMLLDLLGRHHSQNLSFGSGCWIQLKWRLICVWDVPSFNKKLRHLIRQIYARFCMPEHDVLGVFRRGGGSSPKLWYLVSSHTAIRWCYWFHLLALYAKDVCWG